jgi:thioredoxin-related protein
MKRALQLNIVLLAMLSLVSAIVIIHREVRPVMNNGKNKKTENGNRLSKEKSPYLLQHADNPVDWYPWGEEAFDEAKSENKPIFLSIGYSTCHWCHVMEHESFEDTVVARLMNDAFVCVKVDREERPDIDNIYMAAARLATGSGGWPLTIIMTPDRKPFFTATYIPKESAYGRPTRYFNRRINSWKHCSRRPVSRAATLLMRKYCIRHSSSLSPVSIPVSAVSGRRRNFPGLTT